MSVSGTPVTTYDDGFPKAHPSLPPSTRRSGRRGVHRRTLLALTDAHGRPQASVSSEGWGDAISSGRAREPRHSSRRSDREHRGEGGRGGGALGNPSSYVVTGAPAPDRRAVRQTVRPGFPRPHPPHPPGGSAEIGAPEFRTEPLRHRSAVDLPDRRCCN